MTSTTTCASSRSSSNSLPPARRAWATPPCCTTAACRARWRRRRPSCLTGRVSSCRGCGRPCSRPARRRGQPVRGAGGPPRRSHSARPPRSTQRGPRSSSSSSSSRRVLTRRSIRTFGILNTVLRVIYSSSSSSSSSGSSSLVQGRQALRRRRCTSARTRRTTPSPSAPTPRSRGGRRRRRACGAWRRRRLPKRSVRSCYSCYCCSLLFLQTFSVDLPCQHLVRQRAGRTLTPPRRSTLNWTDCAINSHMRSLRITQSLTLAGAATVGGREGAVPGGLPVRAAQRAALRRRLPVHAVARQVHHDSPRGRGGRNLEDASLLCAMWMLWLWRRVRAELNVMQS